MMPHSATVRHGSSNPPLASAQCPHHSLADAIPHAHPRCACRWRDVKFAKKAALAKHIKEVTGYEVSTQPMFDVQVRGGRGRRRGVAS